MDITQALEASKNMKVPVRISTISAAGHQIFMDNPDGFIEAVMSEVLIDSSMIIEDTKNVQYLN